MDTPNASTSRPSLGASLARIVRDSLRISLELFKIMVPVVIAVKILQELGAIAWLARPLAPLMGLVGLPAETGLVWATAMLNNIYSGILVFASLPLAEPLSVAQVTVLSTMILVAHGLPVELRIAQRSGTRLGFQLGLRFLGALAFGAILHTTYSSLDVLQEPARMLWQPAAQTDTSLTAWAIGQTRNFASIFLIILGLVAFVRLLERIRATEAMNRVLGPLLRLLGIGPTASTITIVGLTMGLSYGGGLIIHEAKSGGVSKRDVFYAVSLMGLCHSLFEDTLLMMLLGAHTSGILWGRLLLSLAAVALLVRLTRRMADPAFEKRLGRSVA
ncbi:hypothetical protein PCS_03366 [Desulfocurvibacter africanus PCS]|uniref:Nucleoside transporter/FeoB GTPase Gate domain-containing protein n=1 Tax=Desulfocurvibacter africanus PCS TaxID=1262666 RepID=M5Q0Q5_DESAF|nr:hypothetical protein [Desulfocurvibacter africanus]EMG35883.1 hypothetical protein PCS_03366 [Desulfocurvibacter africanus PCS]